VHADAVLRIAQRILGSTHDAEDVAQDVFCEAFQLRSSSRICDWSGMLRRMAVLRSIDRLRRNRFTVELDPAIEGNACDPSQPMIAKELADRLRSSLGRLQERQAAVFSLAYFEQLPRDEIAASLGISPAAVSTALYKARQRLGSLLTEVVQETGDD
jgi:RNA polymerase sigma-70 factor (ECF subfamily)